MAFSGCLDLLWFVGWGLQGLARLAYNRLPPEKRETESHGLLSEQVNVKWHWRLLFGYPPTDGKVAIRPAVFQITAILMAAIWLTLAVLMKPERLNRLASAFFILYGLLNILILAFLNRG